MFCIPDILTGSLQLMWIMSYREYTHQLMRRKLTMRSFALRLVTSPWNEDFRPK